MRRRALMGTISTPINKNYLTIEPLEDSFTVYLSGSYCYYRIDYGEWIKLETGTNTPSINVGQTIQFKRDDYVKSLGTFSTTGGFNLSGNCMSMLYGDKAADYNSVGYQSFLGLFRNSKVRSVDSKFLPATTLANYCYSSMFRFCGKLRYIKAMFTTTPSVSYTYDWVWGVSSTGTFVKNKNATWNVVGNNGIPNGWTVKTE